eukprot:TRINITY_DN50225_c0_g1_i1.p2 TRINITY_DN50225_c0_g1~~TRINITY_DN50225_c0_g1_i1.p2  ORF type:complete len:109 (+),score=14.93 TRINITY_DN50225_c0_g1_i1:338-664(+)
MLALKHWVDHGGVLVALVKWRNSCVGEPLVIIVGPRLDIIVVDTDPLVGVADAHGEVEIVLKVVVSGEVEFGEGGGVDVDFELVGAEDEPEDEDDDAENDDYGDDKLQ